MFQPTKEMVEAATDVFVAKAFLGTIEPVVRGYQTAILAKGQWRVRPEYQTGFRRRGGAMIGEEVITDPKLSYLMSEEDFALYDAECKKARVEAKLHVEKEEQCPLCVAEHELIKAKQRLIGIMEPITKLSWDRLLCGGVETTEQAVDLTLNLLGPYVPDVKRDAAKGRETAAKPKSKSTGPGF